MELDTENEDTKGMLPESECYLDKETGDLFIINWVQNRPIGSQWVRISMACYHTISGMMFKRKG
jgi:hypothetical protein